MIYVVLYLSFGVITAIVLAMTGHLQVSEATIFDEVNDSSQESFKSRVQSFAIKFLSYCTIIGFASILWPIMLSYRAFAKYEKHKVKRNQKFRIQPNDLKRQFSISEIELLEHVVDPLNAVPNQPFGHLYLAWKKYTEDIKKDDLIYEFSTTWTTNWGQKEQLSGYVAVKGKMIGSYFLTVKNLLEL